MQVRVDALGNIIGRLEGKGPKVFLTGSHLDTVPDAGKYDGMLGVLIGIAAAQGDLLGAAQPCAPLRGYRLQ
jgi:allantoate deiminase